MTFPKKVLTQFPFFSFSFQAVERHRTKCGQYWPEDVGASLRAGPFEVTSTEIENCDDFVVTHLSLSDERTGHTRSVCHFQFVSWPDYGVPDSALSMLHFLQRVREKQVRRKEFER